MLGLRLVVLPSTFLSRSRGTFIFWTVFVLRIAVAKKTRIQMHDWNTAGYVPMYARMDIARMCSLRFAGCRAKR